MFIPSLPRAANTKLRPTTTTARLVPNPRKHRARHDHHVESSVTSEPTDGMGDTDEAVSNAFDTVGAAAQVPEGVHRAWPDVMFMQLCRWHITAKEENDVENSDQLLADVAFELSRVHQVTHLTIHDTQIHHTGLAALVVRGLRTTPSMLTELTLSFCALSDVHLLILGEYLFSNPPLTSLALNHNHIIGEALRPLVRGLSKNRRLRKLSLHGNALGNVGAVFVSQMMRVGKVQEMNLNFCEFLEDGLVQVASGVKSSVSLKRLSLDGNMLSSVSALAILDAVRASGVVGLSLNFTKSYSTKAFQSKLRELLQKNAKLDALRASAQQQSGEAMAGSLSVRKGGGGPQSSLTDFNDDETDDDKEDPIRTVPNRFKPFTTNEPSLVRQQLLSSGYGASTSSSSVSLRSLM